MRFYEVIDQVEKPGRWNLGGLSTARNEEVDEDIFTVGAPTKPLKGLRMVIEQAGEPLPFTFSLLDTPVVRRDVAEVIDRLSADGDLQRVPVLVVGNPTGEDYEILNVLRVVDCLDEARSEFSKPVRPDPRLDRICRYDAVDVLRIDPSRTQGAHIFRVHGWLSSLIVSEPLKLALAALPVSGVEFELVG